MENNYAKLRQRGLTRDELMPLTWAIEYLGKSIGANNVWESLNQVKKSQRYLSEFLGNILPVPTLTEAEGNMSIAFHTYMRKCMDCPLGVMLYRLIAEGRGVAIWYSFCKGLVENKDKESSIHRLYHLALKKSQENYNDGYDTTDDLLMLSALQMWEEDFDNDWESVNNQE